MAASRSGQYVLWPAAAEDAQGNVIPIDPGDRFVFEFGIPPTPGVDSLLFAIQNRPLSDPDVQQGYQQVIDCLGAINRGTGIGPVCGAVTPTLVSLVRAAASPDRATVLWRVEEPGAPATVYRQAPGRGWEAVSRLHADGSGMVSFEDRDVVPGARYGYRLGLGDRDAAAALGDVWLEIPVTASLALYGLQPNPSRADLVVAFSLATRQPATIELLDLSGRRALLLPLGAPGPGSHRVKLGDRGRFAPGVYWLRLTQGARSATRKVVVLE